MFRMSSTTTIDDNSTADEAERQIKIVYEQGNIFQLAQVDTIMVHACNCQGTWGKGFALQVSKRFPEQFEHYKHYCNTHEPEDIIGSCLVLGHPDLVGCRIACLFTSEKTFMGAFMSPKAKSEKRRDIIKHTKTSMESLLQQILQINKDSREFGRPMLDRIVMPKINSGLFATPWGQTEAVLKALRLPEDPNPINMPNIIYVYRK